MPQAGASRLRGMLVGMKLRNLGSSGLRVSGLALGAMTFGRSADERVAARMVDRYLEAGGNLIDTANVYANGASEEMLGRILEGRRQLVAIATKVCGPMGAGPFDRGLSRKHILEQVEGSLRRLRTDHIDLYQIHSWDYLTPIEETMAALDDCVRAGKVRYLGASNVTGWQLATAQGVAERAGGARFVALQPEYSLLQRGLERELTEAAAYHGLGMLPWSPLAGGLLTGKYRAGEEPPEGSRGNEALRGPWAAAWKSRATDHAFRVVQGVEAVAESVGRPVLEVALRWVMQKPGVIAPILGARTEEQLVQQLRVLEWSLDDASMKQLDALSAQDPGYPYNLLASRPRS